MATFYWPLKPENGKAAANFKKKSLAICLSPGRVREDELLFWTTARKKITLVRKTSRLAGSIRSYLYFFFINASRPATPPFLKWTIIDPASFRISRKSHKTKNNSLGISIRNPSGDKAKYELLVFAELVPIMGTREAMKSPSGKLLLLLWMLSTRGFFFVMPDNHLHPIVTVFLWNQHIYRSDARLPNDMQRGEARRAIHWS